MKFIADKNIFDKFPNLYWTIPVITGFDNIAHQDEIYQFLQEEQAKLRVRMTEEQLLSDPKIAAFLEMFAACGMNIKKIIPTHYNMSKRVLEGASMPNINSLVNLHNAMIVKWQVPFGGEDASTLYGDLRVQFAEGGEQWIPMGGGKSKPPLQGELIWRDDYDVDSRGLNWRQCERTKLTSQATSGFFVVDGFRGVTDQFVDPAVQEFISLAKKWVGGNYQVVILDKDHPEVEVDFQSNVFSDEAKTSLDKQYLVQTTSAVAEAKNDVVKTSALPILTGVAKEIRDLVNKALNELKLETVEFSVTHPKEESHGDYSVNVAMILAKKLGNNPRELAQDIVEQIYKVTNLVNNFEKIEVAGAGFINFYLKSDYFIEETKKAIEDGYGKNENLAGKKVMVEYTDPNPFKEMHIGHLMSNTIGESLARLLEASGAEVKRACYQGDVGLHVAKSVWGMKKKLDESGQTLEDLAKQGLKERQKFMGAAYAYGASQYESDEQAKAEMHALNKQIYQGLDLPVDARKDEVMELYHTGRAWSLEYFETIYQRLGTKFDEYFFESEAGPVGLQVVEEGLNKGVLELGEGGAVVYKGEKDGLHTRVFRNALGLATYEGKELGLAKTKYQRYKYDLSYIVTANEITEYFKVLLAVMAQLYPELAAKTTHMPHGMMKLTTGKMSSRSGVVVTGEGLLNDLQQVVLEKIGEREIENKEMVADRIAVGALKYTVLKQAVGGDIVYDPEKMTNLEGATGPFVQYTYARAKSILRKVQVDSTRYGTLSELLQGSVPCREEMSLLRWIYRYSEVVTEAGVNMAPHLVATYITELAARFNTFYQACRVEEKGEVNELRYLLTQATANVLKSGLNILGIQAPEEM